MLHAMSLPGRPEKSINSLSVAVIRELHTWSNDFTRSDVMFEFNPACSKMFGMTTEEMSSYFVRGYGLYVCATTAMSIALSLLVVLALQ